MSHPPRSGESGGRAGREPWHGRDQGHHGPVRDKQERGTGGRDNPLHHREPAGEAGRVPVLSLWDETPPPSWSQLRRRLRDDPGVRALLLAELSRHPATAGRLAGLRAYRTPAPHPSHSTWFEGSWVPDGTDVLVKINITPRERFWMTAASAATTGLVPRVLASDGGLGDLDVGWLVLERLPYAYDPAWGAAGFSALLAAAARFQVFAAGVDTPLVYEEGAGTIGHWAAGGRELCADAEVLVRRLDADWAWVTGVAPPEVMFGDLHFGNAVFRAPPPGVTALLFDPIPRRQPWPFEPAYFEVVCGGSGLVAEMAAIRSQQGRPTGGPDEVGRLGVLYCAWMALLSWSIRRDEARRARLAEYVTAAARIDR
jgi:hypothetical protein